MRDGFFAAHRREKSHEGDENQAAVFQRRAGGAAVFHREKGPDRGAAWDSGGRSRSKPGYEPGQVSKTERRKNQ